MQGNLLELILVQSIIAGADPGGATGGCSPPPLSSSDHTPYLHEYQTYSGISNKEVVRKLSAGRFPTETACDSQNESDTESTRTGDENGSQFRPRARRIFVGLDINW